MNFINGTEPKPFPILSCTWTILIAMTPKIGKVLKNYEFPGGCCCETKTSYLSMWNCSKTHFVAERNSPALTSVMLDRRVTELNNHREAYLIRASLAAIGQKIQWVEWPVIQLWCGARNAGSQNGWKLSLPHSSLGIFLHLFKFFFSSYWLLFYFLTVILQLTSDNLNSRWLDPFPICLELSGVDCSFCVTAASRLWG